MIILAECFIIFFIVFFMIAKGINVEIRNVQKSLIPLSVSAILKSVCCIVILLHHYAFRVDIPIVGDHFQRGGALFALNIFMFLSAYGIVKSEKMHNLSLIDFVRRRILKLLKPFWVVCFIGVIAYYLIGAVNDGSQIPLDTNPYVLMPDRISESFFRIGSRTSSIWQYLLMVLGIDRIDGVDWFLRHILISYCVFWISKSIFHPSRKKILFSITYIVLIVFVGAFYAINDPFVSTNVWYWYSSLALGVIMSVFEEELLQYKHGILAILGGAIFVFCLGFLLHNKYYIIYTMLAVFLISFMSFCMQNVIVKRYSLLYAFSISSYVFYLMHVKILNIEWWYIGYKSVLLPFVITSCISLLYYHSTSWLEKKNC